jgi:ribonuclease HI/uncharacterized protein YlaI
MGIGWIIKNNNQKTIAEFKGETSLTPSSTKAELSAILSAISTINFNKKINIITDSQNAITNIKKRHQTLLTKNTKEKKNQMKTPNTLLIDTIIELLTIKNIKWKLTKIKGHSNNPGNDKADELATIDLSTTPKNNITIEEKEILSHKITLKWDQKHYDAPIKSTIQNISKTKWASKWRTLKRTNEWLNKEKAKEINWPLTLQTLTPSKITNPLTNKQDSSMRTFRIKTWLRELPTINKLHERKPTIYKDNKCKICSRNIDIDLHPLTCGINIQHLRNKYTTYLTEECAARTNGNTQKEKINLKWKNTQIFTEHKDTTKPWHKTEWLDILRGVITHKLVKTAEQITGNKSMAKEAILKATERFWTAKYKVWKFRCDIVIQWEKEQNITKKMKK